MTDDGELPGEYLDFEVSIWAERRRYFAKVTDSPAGQSSIVPLKSLMATAKDAENVRLRLENALLRAAGGMRGAHSPEEKILRDFGNAVFDSIFRQATPIADQYAKSVAMAQTQSAGRTVIGLRVKLRIDAPELAQLPWEYLYNKLEDKWLSLYHISPVTRVLDVDRPPRELTVNGPLNVLGMIVNPGGEWGHIDAEKERHNIEQAVKPLKEQGKVKFSWVHGETAEHLVAMMSRTPWHVFHFIGHGGLFAPDDAEDNDPKAPAEGFVVLKDERGMPNPIPGSDLKMYLEGLGTLRLVVLNCCEGAREGSGRAFSSPATALVRDGIPAVVGMQFPISDDVAVQFASAFYAKIAANWPIEAALTEARKLMQVKSRVEWGIPVLYSRSQSGRLFGSGIHQEPGGATPIPPTTPAIADELVQARARLRALFSDGPA